MTKHIPWGKNDALFKKELKEGLEWQDYVADKLQEMGWEVEVVKVEFKEGFSKKHKFKDLSDLRISKDGTTFVAEVKSRRLDFTCPEDYPWPTVFIDTVEGHDAKPITPDIHIVVSRKTGKMIGLPKECTSKWNKERVFDRVRRIPVHNYTANKDRWMTIEMALQEVWGETCRHQKKGTGPKGKGYRQSQRSSVGSKKAED